MLVGGKWFWCCKDNIIFPLRHHRTARVFPTPRAFSVRPPHSARWATPNCALLPYLFTSSAPSSAFSCFSPSPFGTKRRTSGTFHSKFPVFHPKFPIFVHLLPRFAARLTQHTRLVPFAAFFLPICGRRQESNAQVPSTHAHILRRRCAFPLPLSQSPVISHHHAPLASSSRLLRSQTFPSTRPIPPHTSVFSGSFIHNYPLPQVVNPTFPPLIGDTFSRHDTKAHDSHNNSMLSLPFFHSNSTFVV